MSAIQLLVGLAVGGFLAVLAFGLATGRIAWRQQGCCPADPALDARMRAADPTTTTDAAQPRT
jgi:hypothetical protein